MGHRLELRYAVDTDPGTPANTWITNTATLSSSFVAVQRRAATLINPVDLSASRKTAPAQVTGRESLSYTLTLQNTGVRPANEASLDDPLPAHTAYAPGSLACSSGACAYSEALQAVRWSGRIASNETVTLSFAVAPTGFLADQTPITNTATLSNGYGVQHTLQAVTLVRNPDLSGSFQEAAPEVVQAGETATFTLHVHNAGLIDTEAEVQDTLPAGLTYAPGSLSCGVGTCQYDAGVLTWEGLMRGNSMAPIQFQVTMPEAGWPGQRFTNRATVHNRTTGQRHETTATVALPGDIRQTLFLPVVGREGQ
jgi:uncharacterized repeat protein (TIGR01451 family)